VPRSLTSDPLGADRVVNRNAMRLVAARIMMSRAARCEDWSIVSICTSRRQCKSVDGPLDVTLKSTICGNVGSARSHNVGRSRSSVGTSILLAIVNPG